jgi:hypothetical protein
MRAHGEQPRRQYPVLLRISALAAAVVGLTVAVAAATTSKPVAINDAAGDVSGPLDLQRVALHRSSDGHLRAILTFAGTISAGVLLAESGPPGSACLRIWTDPAADPAATRPDRLVCVTARSSDELRAGVYMQRGLGLPQRVATPQVRANASRRAFVLRLTQSSLGRPASIRFAAETTRPGCDRTTCIDTAPEAGRIRRFRLR